MLHVAINDTKVLGSISNAVIQQFLSKLKQMYMQCIGVLINLANIRIIRVIRALYGVVKIISLIEPKKRIAEVKYMLENIICIPDIDEIDI